jgi:hypothetical protein
LLTSQSDGIIIVLIEKLLVFVNKRMPVKGHKSLTSEEGDQKEMGHIL